MIGIPIFSFTLGFTLIIITTLFICFRQHNYLERVPKRKLPYSESKIIDVMDRAKRFCKNTVVSCYTDVKIRNIVVACILVAIMSATITPASAVQNIALADSTEVSLKVGYFSEIAGTTGSMVMGVLFSVLYKFMGLRIVTTLTMGLTSGYYWPMMWVVDTTLIYIGGFLAGSGRGAIWIVGPMIIMDNSRDKITAQRNMGYFWVAKSLGDVFGGTCNYFYFNNITVISARNRFVVYGVCALATILGAVFAGFWLTEAKSLTAKRKKKGEDDDPDLEGKKTTSFADDNANMTKECGVALDDKVDPKAKSNENSLTIKKNNETGIEVSNTKPCTNDLENSSCQQLETKTKSGADPSHESNTNENVAVFDHSWAYSKTWFKNMAQRLEFWILLIPLFYWAFLWGYLYKIMPTAIGSVFRQRNIIPLSSIMAGVGYLVGSTCWNTVTRWTNNSFCVVLQTAMLLVALLLSVLIFPRGAASTLLDPDTVETYITPDTLYVVAISVLLALADSGVSITYYTVCGVIFGEGNSLGYALVNNLYYLLYVVSMFAPSLFDLHSYCYSTAGAVLVMCLSFTIGLRRFM